tara:strand:- start:597 stop:1220 length:624 start_codon:yes stop_codon:yes gene_type:complete
MSSTTDDDSYHTAKSSISSDKSSRNSSSSYSITPLPEPYPDAPLTVERGDAYFTRAVEGPFSRREAVEYPRPVPRPRIEELSRNARKAAAELTNMHGVFRTPRTSRIARDKKLADKEYERRCQAREKEGEYDWKLDKDRIPGFHDSTVRYAGIVTRKSKKRKSKAKKPSSSKRHRPRRSTRSRRQTRRIYRRKPIPYGRSKSRKTKN